MRTLTQSSAHRNSSITENTPSTTRGSTPDKLTLVHSGIGYSTRAHAPRTTSTERAQAAVLAMIGQKSYDVRALHVGETSDIADYFVIASGTSDRHVKGIADKVKDALRQFGESPVSVSGYESAEWIILDFGDLVAHIFYEPARQYYDFDRLWSHAPLMELPDELETQVKRLRTGMVQAS